MYLYIIAIYSVLLLTIHIIPTGGGGVALNAMAIASVRTDYLMHMTAFLPWMVLVWFYHGTRNLHGNRLVKKVIYWLCAGLFLAVFAEGIQYWLPYRSFNSMDVVFNVFGIVFGTVIFVFKPGRREGGGK